MFDGERMKGLAQILLRLVAPAAASEVVIQEGVQFKACSFAGDADGGDAVCAAFHALCEDAGFVDCADRGAHESGEKLAALEGSEGGGCGAGLLQFLDTVPDRGCPEQAGG